MSFYSLTKNVEETSVETITIVFYNLSSLKTMELQEFLHIFRQFMAILCCLFGLPGNLLTIIVCLKSLIRRRINFERNVFDLYLVEISLFDTFLLLYWVIDTLISYLHSIHRIEFFSLMHLSPFACFFSFLLNRLCAALSSWLITCFTLIRFLHIFRHFNTIKSNLILLTSLILIFSFANSYVVLFLTYDSTPLTSTMINGTNPTHPTSCHIRSKYSNDRLILLLNTLVAGVLNLGLPSILILIVNIMMLGLIKRIYTQSRDDKIHRRTTNETNVYRSTRSTLLVISVTYTLFYLPYCVFYLLMITFDDQHDTLHYWSEITYILRHVSHSVNFYAYIFTNLRFRREILSLFRCFTFSCRIVRQEHHQTLKMRKKIKSTRIIVETRRLPPLRPSALQKGGHMPL